MKSQRTNALQCNACRKIDRAVAGGDHVDSSVFDYIRALQQSLSQPEPLTLAIARQLSLLRDREAYLFTGFVVPGLYPHGENDGPLGTLVLARALQIAGVIPTIWVDPPLTDTAMWLAAELSIDIPVRAIDLMELAQDHHDPATAIAIEKPGSNSKNIMHTFDGIAIVSGSIPIDTLFANWHAAGTLTLGIGDRGNEIGFGALHDEIAFHMPSTLHCQCGCGGGVVAATSTQLLLPAAVSNWGAYGIAAAMALLANDKRLLLTPTEEGRLLRVAAVRGCVDGIQRRGCYGVDGLSGETSVAVVREIQRIALDGLTK